MKRRIFLRGAGGVAVAAPFLGSLGAKTAKAAVAAPTRLVVFFTHNGCLTNRWFPQKEDGPLSASDLEGTYLSVLSDVVDRLLIPRGFRSMNQYATVQTIDPHDQAMGSKLTCATISTERSRYATAESLDHVIARAINPNGASPLVLGVGASSTSIKEVLSFSGPEEPFPANVNPQTVYTQLTGILTSGGGGPPMGEADFRLKLGQSAIDIVREDLDSLRRLKMSSADKERLQQWLDLLRDTENGMMDPELAAACSTGTAMTLGATAEAVAEASPAGPITPGCLVNCIGPAQGEADNNLATSFTKGGDMMMNLMALSMICDVNRMLMLVYPGYVKFNWDGINHTHEHHGLSHRTGDASVGGACGVEGVLDKIAEIDTWYTSKYAKLVHLLESISEGETSLLDNTATMWLPELSDGNSHNTNNLPIVIAGSAGGYLKQSAIVNVEQAMIGVGNSESSCQNGGQIGFNTGSNGGNVPINKLYVTLMNALGMTADDGGPVREFGVFDSNNADAGITNPGEVAELKA